MGRATSKGNETRFSYTHAEIRTQVGVICDLTCYQLDNGGARTSQRRLDKQTDDQTDRQRYEMKRMTDRQTDRQTDRRVDGQLEIYLLPQDTSTEEVRSPKTA